MKVSIPKIVKNTAVEMTGFYKGRYSEYLYLTPDRVIKVYNGPNYASIIYGDFINIDEGMTEITAAEFMAAYEIALSAIEAEINDIHNGNDKLQLIHTNDSKGTFTYGNRDIMELPTGEHDHETDLENL